MLELVQSDEQLTVAERICEGSAFSTMIYAQSLAYPPKLDICRFWLQKDSAVICSNAGAVVLCANKSADFEEIGEFLRIVGCISLLTDVESMQRLNLKPDRCGTVMRAKSEINSKSAETPQTTADFRAVFDMLKIVGSFDEWFADIARRIRLGTADMRIVRFGGQIVSTASALHIFGANRILGAVATLPAHRSLGLASRLVKSLTTANTQLLCARELEPFYIKLGFAREGAWAEKLNK